uniref:Methyl-CpG binding domain protein 1b n=1 Tax=Echeneis naucrates TaxID=173247 RepID=A0A665VU42_ECHNA
MKEEPLENPFPGKESVEEDVGQSTEKQSSKEENAPEEASTHEPVAPSYSPHAGTNFSSDPEEESPGEGKEETMDETQDLLHDEEMDEVKDETKGLGGEPPVDWFEPLEEDDDANSVGSLAGESERSESVAGSEKCIFPLSSFKHRLHVPRRKRSHPDEGWEEWPILGNGWKRKEVVRRSGSSIGQKDVYYMSPQGDRVRSRVELASVLEGILDLTNFEYKSGKFYHGEAPPIRIRNRVKVFALDVWVKSCLPFSACSCHLQWIPCGQCVGCHNTLNCGQCANCKHGLQSPESRKRICRKRRCVCPIRKVSCQKRKRRSCGECKACLCRKDCGTCDFCIDKPKFGGSNKKRQKCRLRQCQRQAMRHLLPSQMGQGEYGPDGTMLPGRPRPHYTYSRKSGLKKNKTPQVSLDFTDNEDDDSNLQAVSSQHLCCSKPCHMMGILFHFYCLQITQIFSLADNPTGSGADGENQLMKLLHSLRSSVLPILWYAIMVEGPQLQLIQCSKQSSMADTMVLIDPGFCYQVTVQKQPLLPTHPLYDNYPQRLTSVTEVVNLLLGLEKYIVCQGLPPKQPVLHRDPIILERASTCDFLVKRNVTICFNCRALQGL